MIEVLQFISYINSYLDSDYGNCIDYMGAINYFQRGGCYQLAKIIKHFIPSTEIYRTLPNYKFDHIIVKIGNDYYDTTGLIDNDFANENFYLVDPTEEKSLLDYMGIKEVKIEGKSVDEFIIQETEIIINENKGKGIDKIINTILENLEEEKIKDKHLL